jgi:hypothetical protein
MMGIAALLTAAAAYASTWLTVDTSTDHILAADLPFRQAERTYEAAFPKDDAAVVVAAATPEPGLAETSAARGRHGLERPGRPRPEPAQPPPLAEGPARA